MKIQLPGFAIADLYKDLLVITDDATTKSILKPQHKITKTNANETAEPGEKFYSGGNKKNILFLVNDADAVFINDEALATLTKLLNALKFTLDDVAVINFFHNQINFETLKKKLQPKHIFLFDVTTQQLQLPFTIPHYQIQQFDNCIFLTAPAKTLSSNNDDFIKKEKRKLWEGLKKIFLN